jgi:Flp pilus assembly protein TadD
MRTRGAILAAVVLCTVLSATTVHAAEDRDPGVKNKHFRSAVDLLRNKEYAAAKALFTLALKDHPDSMALLRASGYCCMKLGQVEEATTFYKVGYPLDSGYPKM